MKLLKFIPILLVLIGNFPHKNLVYAEIENPNNYKVFSESGNKLSIANVDYYIKEGD